MTRKNFGAELKGHVNFIYKQDKAIFKKLKGMAPTYHFAFLCLQCKKVKWATAICNMTVEELRKSNVYIAAEVLVKAIREGCECGGRVLLIGYILCSEAWEVEVKGKMPNVPPSKHPNRVEIYTIVSNSIFGKAGMGRAKILRKGDDVELNGLKFNETDSKNIGGELALPLPNVEEMTEQNPMFG